MTIKTYKPIITFPITLGKYLAICGLCARRKAVELIKSGKITVNHGVITNPAHRISEKDAIRYQKKEIKPMPKAYILLNKPKGYVTTVHDEFGRATIFDLLKFKENLNLHSVGRLDKDTTGVLLITNDGELTEKLAHPSHEIKKTYHATLNKPLEFADKEKIKQGFFLEDGFIHVDHIFLARASEGKVVGIELHSGKKHIIKRIFKALGYQVKKLDRVQFAGLSKKGLPYGSWRYLSKTEIEKLTHL